MLRDRLRVAVSLGFGPRFLHSTGQLHKGGPRAIVCVQVLGDDALEIAIPGRDFGFGHLKAAQAAGDLRTLVDRGHPGRARRPRRPAGGGAVKLGMVGLGRMGGNMAERLRAARPRGGRLRRVQRRHRRGHPRGAGRRAACAAGRVGHGPGRRAHRGHRGQPRRASSSAATSSSRAATPTGATASGGPSCLAGAGIGFIDAGTSGGVWGLTEGYCLMVGGERPARGHRPARLRRPRPRGRLRAHRRRRHRPLHEDGAQRHRVRAHAGLRRGLRAAGPVRPRDRRRRRAARVAAGERGALVAARPLRAGPRAAAQPRRAGPGRPGLRRGALDRAGGDRAGRRHARHHRGALRPLREPGPRQRRHEGHRRAARAVRRPRRAPRDRRRATGEPPVAPADPGTT